jgi:hypothetical protein
MAKEDEDLIVEGRKIKFDNGYMSLTDIASLKGTPSPLIQDWLRLSATLAFVQEWEIATNPGFNVEQFAQIRAQTGAGSFRISANQLNQSGCIGIYSKRGRNGGTYAAVEWAIHFTNWLDPKFYLGTLRGYLKLLNSVHGKHMIEKRMTRELASETLRLPTGKALSSLPASADPLFERRFASIEADMINLAMWGMTAMTWRAKFPQENARKNMRDFATKEELKAVTALQVISQEMQENGYSAEERLVRLTVKADEYIKLFCSTPEKEAVLELAQHKRGWGRFTF